MKDPKGKSKISLLIREIHLEGIPNLPYTLIRMLLLPPRRLMYLLLVGILEKTALEENKAELRMATSLNQYEGKWDEVAPYPGKDNIFFNFVVSV